MSKFSDVVLNEDPVKVEPLGGGKSGAKLAFYKNNIKAVIKEEKELSPSGSATQRGLWITTLPYREVCFYKLAKKIGWEDIVPEVVLINFKGKNASAQSYVPALNLKEITPNLESYKNPGWVKDLVKTCELVSREKFRRMILLDIIAGSRDRHSSNVGFKYKITGDRIVYDLVAWDNACTFGRYFKFYHNVFHKRLFRDRFNIEPYYQTLENIRLGEFTDLFEGMIHEQEINHAFLRLQYIIDFPYKIPWRLLSEGEDNPNKFPIHKEYFESPDMIEIKEPLTTQNSYLY